MRTKSAIGTRPVLEASLVLAWSSGFIGARLASESSSVFLVLFWRFAIAAVLLSLATMCFHRYPLTIRSVVVQGALGALGMFGYLAFGIRAIDLGVPLGTAAMISAVQPLATAALAGPLLGESVTRRQWAGLVMGFGGVSLAVGGSLGRAVMSAYLLSILGAICLVAATLLAKRLPDDTPLLPSLAIQSIISAVLFVPLALHYGSLKPEANPEFIAAVIWFILFSTVAAYGLYWVCLRRGTVARIGSLIYLTPPVTMIWAWLMFTEPIEAAAIVGFFVCIAGVFVTRQPAER